jgi:hypothetical protein
MRTGPPARMMIANMGPMPQPHMQPPQLGGVPVYNVMGAYMPTQWHQSVMVAPAQQPTMQMYDTHQSPAPQYWQPEPPTVAGLEPPCAELDEELWQPDP